MGVTIILPSRVGSGGLNEMFAEQSELYLELNKQSVYGGFSFAVIGIATQMIGLHMLSLLWKSSKWQCRESSLCKMMDSISLRAFRGKAAPCQCSSKKEGRTWCKLSSLTCPYREKCPVNCVRALPRNTLPSSLLLRRMPRNVRESGKPAQICSRAAGDSKQPGSGSTEEFTVTCIAQLFMFTGPLCKTEPTFQKQTGDFENVTLSKLLLRVQCWAHTE